MRIHPPSVQEIWKALGIGVLTSLILSAVMVPAFLLGIAPMPKQPSLAFAEWLLKRELPLPVGLLFHVAYLTFWSLAYVVLFRHDLSFRGALSLSLFLWAIILVVFFPLLGWGFFGLGVSPKLIPASFVPHFLFAVVLWGLCQWGFRRS